MSIYQYIAKDKNGNTVKGMLDSASEVEVLESLHKKDLVVISIEQTQKKFAIFKAKGKKIKTDDLVVFSRQLATMIDAGIPLVQALSILIEQIDNPGLKYIVNIVRRDIEAGMSFCDALAKHPQVFSELFINMTKAGEAAGMLDEILDRLATYLEKAAALSRKIQSSLVYPAMVISMAIIITTILLLKVVPTFKGIFETLGGKLPLPTVILIAISDILKKYILFIIGFLIIFAFLFKKYISTKKGHYNFDAQKLKLAVIGPLIQKIAIAKFSRTFSTLIKSGVPVLNGLDIVAKTSGNKVIEEAVLNCSTAVREGEPISQPLAKGGIFPSMVVRMIWVGEQTGQLEKMLSKIADFYEEQVEAQITGLTSLIEPLVIAFLGIFIGGIVISLFLPIFKISELVSK